MIALLRVAAFFVLPAVVLALLDTRYSARYYGAREIALTIFCFLLSLFLMRRVGPFALLQFFVLAAVAVSQTALEYLLARYGYSQKFLQGLWDFPLNYDGILSASLLPLGLRLAAAFIASRF